MLSLRHLARGVPAWRPRVASPRGVPAWLPRMPATTHPPAAVLPVRCPTSPLASIKRSSEQIPRRVLDEFAETGSLASRRHSTPKGVRRSPERRQHRSFRRNFLVRAAWARRESPSRVASLRAPGRHWPKSSPPVGTHGAVWIQTGGRCTQPKTACSSQPQRLWLRAAVQILVEISAPAPAEKRGGRSLLDR